VSTWWNGSAVLWDLETDSVDPTDARIITACVALIKPGDRPEIHNYMAQTERPIPDEASAIHGITTEHADTYGRPRELVIADIAAHLALASGEPRPTMHGGLGPVVGHNIGRYDLTVLDREMRRTGVGSLGHERGMVTVRVDGRQVGAFHVIDTLVLDKHVDPYRKGPAEGGRNRLSVTAEHYGVPIRGNAHTAEADALAAGRVAWAIARRCGMPVGKVADLYMDRRYPEEVAGRFHDLGALTLPELHHAQIGWAAEQAHGLREYFARNPGKGDPMGVSGAWPIEPVGVVDAVTELL
jgi:DNA polymerase III subunit epsilon